MSLVDRALRNAEQHALAELFPIPNPYLADPVGWVEERLGEGLWSKLAEILESVRDNRKTLVVTCNGVGKDWVGGRAAGWWVDVHPRHQTRVVTTAPTGEQVKGIIWQELATVQSGGASGDPLIGEINRTDWWDGRNQVGVGRATTEYRPATFLGLHRPYLLVILDEVQGIALETIKSAERLTTPDDVEGHTKQRILAIGNPDYEGSTLSALCQPDSGWNVIQFGYDATPNFTGEDVPLSVRANLIGHSFVESQRLAYGDDSPIYVASVLGQFPQDAAHGVVPLSWVRRCQGVEATDAIGPLREPVELGVDVGGSADGDWTVVAGRTGMQALPYRQDWHGRWAALESEQAVDMVLRAIAETRATSVKVDEGGVGVGLCGSLRRRLDHRENGIHWGVTVLPVNAGEASQMVDERGRPRFANLKAEMWWEVGRGLSRSVREGGPGRWDLTALDESEITQLTDMRYAQDKAGRIEIEKKVDVKKRTGRSPDDADARLLSFFTPKPKSGVVQAARVVDRRHAGRR